MQASSNAQKVRLMRTATSNISNYMKWHNEMTFLEPDALKPWQPYCSVLGTSEGCVVLQLRLGALVREVSIAAACATCAEKRFCARCGGSGCHWHLMLARHTTAQFSDPPRLLYTVV